jgi:hypothetical protein
MWSLAAHHIDAVHLTRRAIELAGLAAKVAADPVFARTWLSAADSEENYSRFTKKSFPRDIFSNEDDLHISLYGKYKELSQRAHSSILSLRRCELGFSAHEGRRNVSQVFGHHNFPGKDEELIDEMMMHLRAHVLVAESFSNSIGAIFITDL